MQIALVIDLQTLSTLVRRQGGYRMKNRAWSRIVWGLVTALSAVSLTTCAYAEDMTESQEVSVAETESDQVVTIDEALYEGVENYGAEEVNKDTKESFRYRFLVDGEEKVYQIDPGEADEEGEYAYPVQNILKEQYPYELSVSGDTILAAKELPSADVIEYESVVSGTPGVKTLANFLKTALEPVGTALYIYGGGWDWQDVGSSVQTKTIGVSSDWVRFFREQDENFTYKSKDGNEDNSDPATSYYPYGGYNEYYYAGLDCSGYLGWAIYNTLETEDGKDGYVTFASSIARDLAGMGFGEWTQEIEAPSGENDYVMKPGDVMSTNGHVWISLGTCDDNSIVILHSTPAESRTGQPGGGVEISAIGQSEDCEAYQLADRYMSEYYPEWYERYPVKLADPESYFTFEGDNAGRFTWEFSEDEDGFTDPEGIQDMTPSEVLECLFSSKNQ